MVNLRRLQFSISIVLIAILLIATSWRIFILPSILDKRARAQLLDYICANHPFEGPGAFRLEMYKTDSDNSGPNQVRVNVNSDASEAEYKKVFQLLHQLEAIDDLRLFFESDKLPNAVRGNKTVKTLHLKVFEHDPPLHEIIRSCPNCKFVEYGSTNEGPIDAQMWDAIVSLPNLQHLKIPYGKQSITLEQLSRLKSKSIEHLELTGVSLDPRWPVAIAKCSRLVSLKIDADIEDEIVAIDLSPLEKLSNLKSKQIFGWVHREK